MIILFDNVCKQIHVKY